MNRARWDVTFKPAGAGLDEVAYIVALLEDVIYTLADGRLHRAAWRLADAGGRLRRVLESPEYQALLAQIDAAARRRGGATYAETGLMGLDTPSGLGCLLPRIPDA